MSKEIYLLKIQVRRLQLALGVFIILMISFVFIAFKSGEKAEIIRAKGIVIEDEQGRDRILIGAPIPESSDRVRTDTARVRKYWAGGYNDPDQYMNWYKDYRHSAIGMVILNEEGFDRVQVGEKLADPNSGKRLFEAAGLLWNDPKGWERGGAGVNTNAKGQSRSVVGLDDDNGEAVHLVALEDGTKGLIIGGQNGLLMIGMSKEDGQYFINKEAFTGVKYFDPSGNLLWEQKMSKE